MTQDIEIGKPVEITQGSSKAMRGIVVAKSDVQFEPGEPSYVVRLEKPYVTDRTIRATYLRKLEVR